MTVPRRDARRPCRGLTARASSSTGISLFVVIVIILIIIFIALLVKACSANSPGGQPLKLFVTPPTTILQPGVPATFGVQLALAHPLPTTIQRFKVRIDEDDYVIDDTLVKELDLVYDPTDPSRPYAHASFTLTCVNLRPNGKFDLVGLNGTSTNERVQEVHAEGPGPFGISPSDNAIVQCAAPTIDVTEGEPEEGAKYCVYTIAQTDGSRLKVGDKVCVKCTSPNDVCPQSATLDAGGGIRHQVQRVSDKCLDCPGDAKAVYTKKNP